MRHGEERESRSGRSTRLQRDEYSGLRAVLAAELEASGLSQRELSRRVAMKVSYVNKILMGSRTVDIVELVDIARALNLDPVELFRRSLEQTH